MWKLISSGTMFNGELEVLVDCRELDNVVIYEDVNYYQEETVIMVNT